MTAGATSTPPPLATGATDPSAGVTGSAGGTYAGSESFAGPSAGTGVEPSAVGGSPGTNAPPSNSAGAGAPPTVGDVLVEPLDAASYLFDQAQLRTYNVTVAPADLDKLNQDPSAEMYVPAGLEFEGKSYGPISIRYKGSDGAFDPPCTGGNKGDPKTGKCSIKFSFDEFDSKARFFGLKKLNFHSMNWDDSMLRERLGYELYRDMGLASPRAAHARLLINGQLEGLFALVEQIDDRFSKSRFTEGGQGNIYKEIWPLYSDASRYVPALESNKKQPMVQRMLDFAAAVGRGPDATSMFIDRDYTMRFVAVDRVIINDDGVFHFWCKPEAQGNNQGDSGNHNYYWYEAASSNHFWLIPWDLDYAFDGRSDVRVYPQWTIPALCVCGYPAQGTQVPASCDPLVSTFNSWLTDYNAHVDEFIAGPFARDRVNPKLDAWTAQIQSAVIESAGLNGAPSQAAWQLAIVKLKATIDAARTNRGYKYF